LGGEKFFNRTYANDEKTKKNQSENPTAEKIYWIVDSEINPGEANQQNIKEADGPSGFFIFPIIDQQAPE
jgi:hypothetical protein